MERKNTVWLQQNIFDTLANFVSLQIILWQGSFDFVK